MKQQMCTELFQLEVERLVNDRMSSLTSASSTLTPLRSDINTPKKTIHSLDYQPLWHPLSVNLPVIDASGWATLTVDTFYPTKFIDSRGSGTLVDTGTATPATLRKLNRGDVVGLASLVSVAPCETVHASTNLKAALLSDNEVAQLLREVPEFSNWCLNQIWDAELARLIRPIRDASAKDLPPLASKLDSVRSVSKLIDQKPELVQQAIKGINAFLLPRPTAI